MADSPSTYVPFSSFPVHDVSDRVVRSQQPTGQLDLRNRIRHQGNDRDSHAVKDTRRGEGAHVWSTTHDDRHEVGPFLHLQERGADLVKGPPRSDRVPRSQGSVQARRPGLLFLDRDRERDGLDRIKRGQTEKWYDIEALRHDMPIIRQHDYEILV